jgi:MinD-like ATPase involved in chromosome partitioning or flagellar assembly
MSNDETGNTEGQGIPGFSSNNRVPGGFTLPIPVVTGQQDEQPASDPWSSTWADDSWQSEEAASEQTRPADLPTGNAWSDPYAGGAPGGSGGSDATPAGASSSAAGDFSAYEGDYTTYDSAPSGGYTAGGSASSTSSTSSNGWSSWDSGSGTTEADESTRHWQALQHNAEVADASVEEYSGWVPAGSSSTSGSGASGAGERTGRFTTDHTAARDAYASTPTVDPDVAAAAEELGRTHDLTPVDRAGSSDRPSADDLITARSKGERQKVKANRGLRKAFGLGPSAKELLERDRIDRIARPLNGRKTIMVINTKGGGGKTLVTLMLASYLGRYRSGSVLAWDNNETEGTLGMRAPSQSHHRTVVDLLGALPTIAGDPNAGTSELEHWVREQRGLSFDVLASADDDEAMRIIGEQEFEDLHTQLSRFYRMIIVDTGNNRLAPNWLAAAARADLLVFATSLKDDTSVVAAKNLDALVAMGRGDLVRNAVCVISHTSAKGNDIGAGVHTREHFEQWVRAVVDIPYDPMLAPGLHLDPLKINKKTHDACMEMAAVVVDGL